MRNVLFLIILLCIFSESVFSQYAQGPAFGSISTGAVASTGNFSSERPIFPIPVPHRIHNKIPYKLLPDPEVLPPSAGPEGSNYFVDQSAANKVTSSLPPITLGSYPGIPQTTSIPPDPYLAVGPNHVMSVVNTSFRISDKSGITLKTIEAENWYNNVLLSNDAFDPKVLYDHFAGRWIMVWLHQSDATQTAHYLLSVSDDDDPIGTWYSWALPSDKNGNSPSGNWADYQGVGFDNQAIYITSNQFSYTNYYFQYVKVRIIPKAQLYANTAGPVNWTDFWDLRDGNYINAYTTRPTRIYSTPNEYYLLGGSPYSTGTYFVLHRIINPLSGNPTITAVNVPVVTYTSAPNANQLGGGTPLLEGGGSHIRNEPVYMDSSIWAVHSVRSGTGGQYSSVRYVRINTLTNTAIEDAAFGADGYWYIYCALAVDKDKNLALTFSRSGLTEYAGAYLSFRLNNDRPGLSPSVAVKPGEANYIKTYGEPRNRWGDYNGVWIDPSDRNNFWLFTEYAASPANTWGTWLYNFRLTPYSGSRIYTETNEINFGTIEVGKSSDTIKVTLYNYGENPLTISSISNNFSVFTIIDSISLPSNISTFDSLKLKIAFQPTEYGIVNDTVMIFCNDIINSPLKITVKGKGTIIGNTLPGIMYASSSDYPSGNLYTINTETGLATLIGATGIAELQGLAIRPSSKELYGVSTLINTTTMYRVSSIYGDAITFKTIPLSNLRAISFNQGDTLFAATTSGKLYQIDINTGDTIYIGTASGVAYSGLALSPISGLLWASVRPTIIGRDRIYKINTSTGAATLVGSTGDNSITPYIAFSPTGVLYGLKGVGTQINSLISIDTINAAGSTIGSCGVSGLLAIAMRTDSLLTGIKEEYVVGLPEHYSLEQNYPNPFNPVTTINYQLPVDDFVTLKVYNVIGQEVATLVNGIKKSGYHSISWDAGNMPSGVYIYKLTAGTFNDTKKMLLVR